MKKIVSTCLVALSATMALGACKKRNFNNFSSTRENDGSPAANEGYDRNMLSTFNNNIYSTFIIADSLIGDKASFVKLCGELVAEKYNLVFVNVQARGYYMGRPGLKLEYAPGKTMLMPGYPLMKVDSPINELRANCGDKIKFVPWLEYGARAEIVNERGRVNGQNGYGFNEEGNKVYIRSKPAENVLKEKDVTFFPSSWYLINSKTGEVFDEQDKSSTLAWAARWLDVRNPEVKTFLINFTEKLADMYGPVIDWDRVRYPQWTGSGEPIVNIAASEYSDENNSVTQFFRELGSRLNKRNGALWLTVAKPLASRKATNPSLRYLNEEFGQHWFKFGEFSQLIVTMTYYDNTQQFDTDLAFIDALSKRNSFKYLPIVGVDAAYRLFSTKPEYVSSAKQEFQAANEFNLISAKELVSENKVGAAYWYHCFKPSPDTAVCD